MKLTHQQYTKDERLVLAIYEMAKELGDPKTPVGHYAAGARAGLNPKAVDAIGKLLLRANFIKKSDEENIYLTEHGLNLVARLYLE